MVSRLSAPVFPPASRLSEQEFASAYFALEPRLLAKTRRDLHCSEEDAEDVVAEVRRVALVIIERFDPILYDDTGKRVDWTNRFAAWICEILRRQCLNYRTRLSHTVPTVPLDEARNLEATSEPNWREAHQGYINALPRTQMLVVNAHLDGYTNLEIADTFSCSRNTVCNLLKAAERQLREWSGSCFAFDILEELTPKEFGELSKVIVYRKPAGKMSLWKHKLPANRVFRLTPSGRRAA